MSFYQHDYELTPHQPMVESKDKFPLFQRSFNEMKLHESPIRLQKRSSHYSPIFRRSSANGLSRDFHANYRPFESVRIQKRTEHYKPEFKRSFHSPHAVPVTNPGTRDYFSSRSNVPVERGYYPLF